jgi:hypothetical protein
MNKISQKQLLEIANLLRYTPTGDNAQHWQFKVEADGILINHHKELSHHVLNEHFYSSLLSLGCLIEIAFIASSNSNHKLQVEYNLSELDRPFYARLRFIAKDSIDEIHPLFSFITKRETNRRRFKATPLPGNFFDPFKVSFENLGVNIRTTTTIDHPFLKYLIKCDSYIWRNRKVFTDTTKWIRFS